MTTSLAEAEMEARRIVNDWTMGAAAIGWMPGSSIYLAYNQYEMCEGVARAFGVEEASAEATFSAIAGTVVGRTAADVMLSVIPVVGWAVKAGVAAATTKAIGEGIISHYRDRSPFRANVVLDAPSVDIPISAPKPVLTSAVFAPEPPALSSSVPYQHTAAPSAGVNLSSPVREFTSRPRMRVLRRSGNHETVFAEATLGAQARGNLGALKGAEPPLTEIDYEWESNSLSLILHVGGQSEIYLRPDQTKALMKVPRVRANMPAAVPIGPGDELYLAGWTFVFA
jgi:uncharacterized protein (DUF697 family)